VALDDGGGTNDDHRKYLDKDDSPQAVKGGKPAKKTSTHAT